MRSPAVLAIAIAAALAGVGSPPPAEAAGPNPARRGLDLTTKGPSVAAQAAQAAQAPAPAPEAATSAAVSPVTVRPQQRGRVIASSDAASLASPDFTAADAQDPPLAVSLGGDTALGRKVVTNDPPPAGLLRVNPDLIGSPLRAELAVTTVF